MFGSKEQPRRRHILRSFLLICLLLLVAAFGVSYALGWISFQQGDGVFTIRIRTGQGQQDADHAVKKSKDATVETGNVLQSAGKQLKELGGEGEVQPSKTSAIDEPAVSGGDKVGGQ